MTGPRVLRVLSVLLALLASRVGSGAAVPRLTFYGDLVFHQSDFNSPVPEPAALSRFAFGFAVVVAGPAP